MMQRWSNRRRSLLIRLLNLFVCAAFSVSAARAGSLFAINGDNFFATHNQFVSVNTSPPTVAPVATLPHLTDGGLTGGPGGVLYGIENITVGSQIQSSLYRIQTDGTMSLAGVLPGLAPDEILPGYAALTYDPADGALYGLTGTLGAQVRVHRILLDSGGSISSVTTVETLTGFLDVSLFTGLTYDTADGMFWGTTNFGCCGGISNLVNFDLAGHSAFGSGFTSDIGGVTYDAATNDFWAIQNFAGDGGPSQLIHLSTIGAVSAPLLTLGNSTVQLAAIPDARSVPEPSSLVLLGSGIVMIAGIAGRKKTHRA
jgi:hypothetical protein